MVFPCKERDRVVLEVSWDSILWYEDAFISSCKKIIQKMHIDFPHLQCLIGLEHRSSLCPTLIVGRLPKQPQKIVHSNKRRKNRTNTTNIQTHSRFFLPSFVLRTCNPDIEIHWGRIARSWGSGSSSMDSHNMGTHWDLRCKQGKQGQQNSFFLGKVFHLFLPVWKGKCYSMHRFSRKDLINRIFEIDRWFQPTCCWILNGCGLVWISFLYLLLQELNKVWSP